jgi:ketosteroid isomerase-like protein
MMSEHPNIPRMREGYTAFAKGDLAAFDDLWADGIRWHNAGLGPMSGTFEGRQDIFAMFGRLLDVSEGSLRVEPRAFLADDEWGFAAVSISAHRGDRSLATMDVHTARLEDGRVVEFWQTSTEPERSDEFWA